MPLQLVPVVVMELTATADNHVLSDCVEMYIHIYIRPVKASLHVVKFYNFTSTMNTSRPLKITFRLFSRYNSKGMSTPVTP